jgi:hypothetical protein
MVRVLTMVWFGHIVWYMIHLKKKAYHHNIAQCLVIQFPIANTIGPSIKFGCYKVLVMSHNLERNTFLGT